MKVKKIKFIVLTALLISTFAFKMLVSAVHYFPNVTKEMSLPSYWSSETDVLMSYEEIKTVNEQTVLVSETNMYDLKVSS